MSLGPVNRRMITPAAMRLLGQYSWPGNVRELRNVLENLVIFAPLAILVPFIGMAGELLGYRRYVTRWRGGE